MPPQQGRRCVGPCNWDAGEADAQMTSGGVHSSTNVRKRVRRGRGHRRECDAGGGQGLAATPHGGVDGAAKVRKWESRRGGEGGASAGDEAEAASERGGGCEDFIRHGRRGGRWRRWPNPSGLPDSMVKPPVYPVAR
jgi:hypothetical protein